MRVNQFLWGLALIALAILMMLLRHGTHPFFAQTVLLILVCLNMGILARICSKHR